MSHQTLAEFGVNNYGDALKEARQCRLDSAVFDFSFMSRARISGPDIMRFLNVFQSRDLSSMQIGDIRYCLSADADGIVRSDLTVWKFADTVFDIYSGRRQDLDLIRAGLPGNCDFEDLSGSTSVFSIQGPNSLDLLSRLADRDSLAALAYFQHGSVQIDGVACQIGRLGYTGEKGFEIVVEGLPESESVWDALLRVSRPAGVAAIDILRIEAGFLLFLNECRMACNAAELGLGKFSCANERDVRYKLVCFRADEQRIEMPWSPSAELPRPGKGEIVVTSASLSALCSGVVGLGFVNSADQDHSIFTDPSGQFRNIRRVDLPLYDPFKDIPRSSW